MPVQNSEIAAMLNEMADLLEIEGANPFRARAYRNAARTIMDLPYHVADMVEKGEDLQKLPGIGEAIAQKIKTIVKTGALPQLKAEEKRFPPILSQLTKISGLGPKRIKAIYDAYPIKTLTELKKLLESGKIAALTGFGEKTASAIAAGISQMSSGDGRIILADAEKIAQPLMAYLGKNKAITDLELAGSFRRRKETVGDLDILGTGTKAAEIIDYFVKYPDVKKIISRGTTRSSVVLKSGLQVDFRIVPKISYGAALYYFTGSKAHNIAVRTIAVKKHIKINEYGVFRGKNRIAGKTEKEVFHSVGLPFIPPELREEQGEIEAALNHRLPKLITLEDIHGDLHCHTKATDGKNALVDMVKSAQEKGYEYLAITDHSQRLAMVKGLDKKRLLAQLEEIDRLNEKLRNFTILKSIEVDILEDGKLDLPNEVLKALDLTVCSVHSKFNLSEKQQTERILRAMDNPYFNILGHPTGRLIDRRQPYEVDMARIILAAKQHHCILEIDSQPERLDLNEIYARMAKENGVKLSISSDAHSIHQLEFMRFGVYQARRAWLEADDVVNTRSLSQLKKLLRR